MQNKKYKKVEKNLNFFLVLLANMVYNMEWL